MKALLRWAAQLTGVLFMAAAFLQWLTFDYPDINPFWPGATLAPGMLSQVFNWAVVCVLAAIGWGLFTLGKFTLDKEAPAPRGE